jgi:hypothetical protein
MWKPEHRRAAERRGLRYPSDLTDAEWGLIAPRIPPGRRGGRKRSVDGREVLDAIFYGLATGCQWKALPKDLPPKSTAHFYFMLWDWDGTLERIHETLYVADLAPKFYPVVSSLWRLDCPLGRCERRELARSRRRSAAPDPVADGK